MARLAEQAERYEDMIEYMKRVATMGAELSLEERNLLSVAFKNAVGARRSAWRAIHSLEQREASSKGPAAMALVQNYRGTVEAELNAKCMEILDILSSALIPKASDSEASVFYMKMKGDYHRYLAEFASGESHQKHAQDAHGAYDQAWNVAQGLPATHPIRLGLALNFSVFYYEVYSSPDKACSLAKASFDEALAGMEKLDEEQIKDSATIMQLLQDNLNLWTAATTEDGGVAPVQDGTVCEEL